MTKTLITKCLSRVHTLTWGPGRASTLSSLWRRMRRWPLAPWHSPYLRGSGPHSHWTRSASAHSGKSGGHNAHLLLFNREQIFTLNPSKNIHGLKKLDVGRHSFFINWPPAPCIDPLCRILHFLPTERLVQTANISISIGNWCHSVSVQSWKALFVLHRAGGGLLQQEEHHSGSLQLGRDGQRVFYTVLQASLHCGDAVRLQLSR